MVEANRIATSSLGTPRNELTTIFRKSTASYSPSLYEASRALVKRWCRIPIIARISWNLEAITWSSKWIDFSVGNPKKLLSQMRFAIENPNHKWQNRTPTKHGNQQRAVDIERIAEEYEGFSASLREETSCEEIAWFLSYIGYRNFRSIFYS